MSTARIAPATKNQLAPRKSAEALRICVGSGIFCPEFSTTFMIFGTTNAIRMMTITTPTMIMTIG